MTDQSNLYSGIDGLTHDLVKFPANYMLDYFNQTRYKGIAGVAKKIKDKFEDYPFANTYSYSEIDRLFISSHLKFPHPFGITLSVDFIGCDCVIGQNVTIGTNGAGQQFSSSSEVYGKPKLGYCVKVNPAAIISGPVNVGSFSVVAAGAIVTKDVPPFHIVYNVNQLKPLANDHKNIILHALYQRLIIYRGPSDGVAWSSKGYYQSGTYKEIQDFFKTQFAHGDLKNASDDFFRFILSRI
jgi:hypothetical protein